MSRTTGGNKLFRRRTGKLGCRGQASLAVGSADLQRPQTPSIRITTAGALGTRCLVRERAGVPTVLSTAAGTSSPRSWLVSATAGSRGRCRPLLDAVVTELTTGLDLRAVSVRGLDGVTVAGGSSSNIATPPRVASGERSAR